MLAIFCLRLACGMIVALLLLSPAQVQSRFYRVHFLTALGLVAAAFAVWSGEISLPCKVALAASMAGAFSGSVLWTLRDAPAGKTIVTLEAIVLVLLLGFGARTLEAEHAVRTPDSPPPDGLELHKVGVLQPGWIVAGDMTSAALLGTATSAMLMGHSYLIAPAMSLAPLMRLLGGLFFSIMARLALSGYGLSWFWRSYYESVLSISGRSDPALWLPVRWGIGLLGPLVLTWLAWRTARIRSTQSATGILYVVVILVFLGELTSQLLLSTTGFIM